MHFSLRRTPEPSLHAVPHVGTAPFVVEERQEDVQPNGNFTPASALWLSPHLKSSGLLRDLSPEDWHLLVGVLAQMTPNGLFAVTPEVLAMTLGVPRRVALARLERMLGISWQGSPLLRSYQAPNGLQFFAPAPHLFELRRSCITVPGKSEAPWLRASPHPQIRRVPRETLINHSRAQYARPRAEVEAEIEFFYRGGQPDAKTKDNQASLSSPDSLPEGQMDPSAHRWLVLKRALAAVGLSHHQANELLRAFPLDQIERQIEWLPHRQARNPRGYLIAAIEGDYAAPAELRNRSTGGDTNREQNPPREDSYG